jgi:hypothetical protein
MEVIEVTRSAGGTGHRLPACRRVGETLRVMGYGVPHVLDDSARGVAGDTRAFRGALACTSRPQLPRLGLSAIA